MGRPNVKPEGDVENGVTKVFIVNWRQVKLNVKLKQSRNRPSLAQRIPGV